MASKISKIEMDQTYSTYLTTLRNATRPTFTRAESKDYSRIALFISNHTDLWSSKVTDQVVASLEGVSQDLNGLPDLVNKCIDKSDKAFDSLLPALNAMEGLIEDYNGYVQSYNDALDDEETARAAALVDGGANNV